MRMARIKKVGRGRGKKIAATIAEPQEPKRQEEREESVLQAVVEETSRDPETEPDVPMEPLSPSQSDVPIEAGDTSDGTVVESQPQSKGKKGKSKKSPKKKISLLLISAMNKRKK